LNDYKETEKEMAWGIEFAKLKCKKL